MRDDQMRLAERMLRAGSSDEAVEVEAGASLAEIIVLRALSASAIYTDPRQGHSNAAAAVHVRPDA